MSDKLNELLQELTVIGLSDPKLGNLLEEPLNKLSEIVSECEDISNNNSVMPMRLTAENGAKGLLMGEFYETIICHDDEGEPYQVKMPVEWDTIKRIYAKIVEYYTHK